MKFCFNIFLDHFSFNGSKTSKSGFEKQQTIQTIIDFGNFVSNLKVFTNLCFIPDMNEVSSETHSPPSFLKTKR